ALICPTIFFSAVPEERQEALMFWVRFVQGKCFETVLTTLKDGRVKLKGAVGRLTPSLTKRVCYGFGGSDGVPRVAEVLVGDSILKRAVAGLSRLPVSIVQCLAVAFADCRIARSPIKRKSNLQLSVPTPRSDGKVAITLRRRRLVAAQPFAGVASSRRITFRQKGVVTNKMRPNIKASGATVMQAIITQHNQIVRIPSWFLVLSLSGLFYAYLAVGVLLLAQCLHTLLPLIKFCDTKTTQFLSRYE
ncbi:hypothetical protein HW555_011340, partial [Spodoptera exigua]